MIIGHFQTQADRLTGIIQTLIFTTDATIIPVDNPPQGGPHYVITTGDTDLGIAWREQTPQGQSYLRVELDDPSLPNPILCRLMPTSHRTHALLWDRP